MKDAQKPDHVNLATLISRLREGRFVIPDFQREFEWEPWDIASLMRSIFLDYYIGSLLLWRGREENFSALACEPIYAYSNGAGSPEHIVLDGQQRLTAMYYAFMAPEAPAPRRKSRFLYFIRVDQFMEEAYDEAFEYDWTRRGLNLLANRDSQFESHWFPLSTFGQGGWGLYEWVQDYERFWTGRKEEAKSDGDSETALAAAVHSDNGRAFGEYLKDLTEQYQVAYIELERDLELDKVCDIFTQINSRGIRLDVFDLINALLRPKGLKLRHMWREARPRLDFVETTRMNVYILQVMSILRQGYCSPKYLYYLLPGQERQLREADGSLRKEILISDTAEFETKWNEAVDALERAIGLLSNPREYAAVSSKYLPYASILPAFASLQSTARALDADQQYDAQRKIRHWYWASVFTNRYSGSVESTSARDYLDVREWFSDDSAEPALIRDFNERFRTLDLHKETRRGSSVYNGVFNLLVLRGARDWITGNLPQADELDDHHIVPKSWGTEHSLSAEVDTILNRTPLTAETNRKVIRDRLPHEYLPELIESSGETAVRSILRSHLVSAAALDVLLRDPFSVDDFEEFLAERQRAIREAIEDLLVKERLDLEPRVRELDVQLEDIELALRKLVAEALGDRVEHVPQHVLHRIDDRLEAAARRNPALDPGDYSVLSSRLEYADLRELQDIITNRSLWPRFEPAFRSKEMLNNRFSQLSELRNAIRHSRTIDEVTRKDGETAILWFQQVLAV